MPTSLLHQARAPSSRKLPNIDQKPLLRLHDPRPRHQPLHRRPLLRPALPRQIGPHLKDADDARSAPDRKSLALLLLPDDLIQALRQHAPLRRLAIHPRHGARDGDFGLERQVPDLDVASAIDEREHAGLVRRPAGVVDDVFAGEVQQGRDGLDGGAGVAGEGGERGGGGGARRPELDGPVEGAGEDEVAEVDGPARGVEGQAHDGGGVAFVAEAGVDAGFGAGAVVAVAGVDGAFFGADEEGGRVRGGEGHAGGAEVFVFVGQWGEELEVLLRLGEHVDGPAADDAVG